MHAHELDCVCVPVQVHFRHTARLIQALTSARKHYGATTRSGFI